MGEELTILQRLGRRIRRQLCKAGLHTKTGKNHFGDVYCWACYSTLKPSNMSQRKRKEIHYGLGDEKL